MVHLTGLSSIVGAVNFIATIHNMRAPGMGWGRLPLFIWTMLIYSYLVLLALSSLAATATMLLIDRNFGGTFFDPTQGGDALLWQHLFWFFGHPEVYIMILPAFGVFSEVLPVFARKPIFGYKAVAAATAAIAFLGMLVWAHHMFATPTATVVLAFFMLSSFVIAVPTGVKIFNWLATLWRGTIEFTGAAAVLRRRHRHVPDRRDHRHLPRRLPGRLAADRHLLRRRPHALRAFGGAAFAMFAALYYWFPKMTGRMLSEGMGKLSFWLLLIGFNVTFLIQHSAGLSGMPRRIYEYSESAGWHAYNLISTIGAFIIALATLVSLINLVRSLKRGADRRARPVEGQHARVVHPLAAAGEQLRRDPARALGRADEGHPAPDRVPDRGRAALQGGPADGAQLGHGGLAGQPPAGGHRAGRGRRARPAGRGRLRHAHQAARPVLLLLTTVTTMYVAGDPSLALVLLTCLGGSLSAGGAGAVNHWFDRDIDAQMARTATRPVPGGRISPRAALTFGIVLGALSFAELALAVNLLAATLALRASSATCSSTRCG